MTRLACLAIPLLLFVFFPHAESIPVRIEGTLAFKQATVQAWGLIPEWALPYVRSAHVIRQVDDRRSPAYDCWPWEQAAQACFEGADLGEKAIRVIRTGWLRDRRAYAASLVHEGWHLYADQHGYTPDGVAGEAMAIGLQVATLRSLNHLDSVPILEAAVGVHGKGGQ